MYKSWADLVCRGDEELLKTEMYFSSMHKGIMHYLGKYKDQGVFCAVGEECISDYFFSSKETVASLAQGEYVKLFVDNKKLLDL